MLVCSLAVALALLPGATAATPLSGDVVVESGETVSDDVTVASGDVVVRGTVNGDVTALSGTVDVIGEVDGDVSAAAGAVGVSGHVTGDVSSGGGSVEVADGGTVEGAVSAGAGSVTVGPAATVEGDVAAGGGDAEVQGTVDGDVASGQSVVLGPGADVGGDVTYHESLDRAGGAVVAGDVTHETGEWNGLSVADVDVEAGTLVSVPDLVPGWAASVYWVVLALLAGGAALVLAPEFTGEVTARATGDALRSGVAGFAALVVTPVALFAVLLTVVGIPLALAGGALSGFLAWVGLVYGEFVVGRQALAALDSQNRWAALAVGVLGVEALALTPVVGSLFKFVVFLVGFGAVVLALVDRWRDDDQPAEPAAPDPAPGAA